MLCSCVVVICIGDRDLGLVTSTNQNADYLTNEIAGRNSIVNFMKKERQIERALGIIVR
jgi:hypothetical protein